MRFEAVRLAFFAAIPPAAVGTGIVARAGNGFRLCGKARAFFPPILATAKRIVFVSSRIGVSHILNAVNEI